MELRDRVTGRQIAMMCARWQQHAEAAEACRPLPQILLHTFFLSGFAIISRSLLFKR